jgi:hypothetical protein
MTLDPERLAEVPAPTAKPPLYWRLLRLRYLRPNGWQRALFADIPIFVAVVLVLADVASAWTLLVLPLAVAAVVKANDLLTGMLPGRDEPTPPDGAKAQGG